MWAYDFITNKINRSLNIVGFTKQDGKFKSKMNDKKHTLKNFKYCHSYSIYKWLKFKRQS